MMKSLRSIAVVALLGLVSGAALASGIGGEAEAYAGSITGNASSVSSGNAVAASQVNGYGTSFQHTDGISAGTATIGGAVTPTGATVVTGTQQLAQVNSYGTVSGNTPIEVGGSIYNGTGGLSKTDTFAAGNAAFTTAGIGGVVGYGSF